MATDELSTDKKKNSTGKTVIRVILGLALLIPASLACLGGLLVPTVSTFVLSLQSTGLVVRDAKFVGLENYARLFQDPVFSAALGFTLSLLVVRVLVVAVAPLLLALAVNELGRAVRLPVRLLFTLPLAMFAPVVMALIWVTVLTPNSGLAAILWRSLGQASQSWLTDPGRAKGALLFADALYTVGLACGVGLIFYLAALRGSWRQVWKPLVASWGIGLLATLALSLQSFTLCYALTAGGPANATMSLTLYQFNQAFRYFRFGPAAAVASFVLVVLVLLGLAAGLAVVLTGLRLEVTPGSKESGLLGRAGQPGRGRIVAIALLAVMLLGSVMVCSLSGLPVLWNTLNSLKTSAEITRSSASLFPSSPSLTAYSELAKKMPIGQVFVNTLLPLSLSLLLLQIPIAYLGALGIGAARPLGKWSEWLLLLFSPWLFVTVGPLSIVAYQNLQQARMLNTLAALTPPIVLSVPMLFILTLFFKGQEPKWRAAQAEGQGAKIFFTKLILPSLPLVALLASAAFLIGLQDLLWPSVASNTLTTMTLSTMLLRLRAGLTTGWPMLAAAITLFELPTFAFFFLVLGALQFLYLDRLALVTHSPEATQDAPLRQDVAQEV